MNFGTHIRTALLMIATMSAIIFSSYSSAQSRIVALVNSVPITSYEVDQRLKLLKLTTRTGSKAKALEELIEERLKLEEATKRGVSVNEKDVDNAFSQIAGRTKMSPAQLSQALNKSGVNPATLKNRLRAEMAWSSVVRMRFRRTVRVEEADVIATLRNRSDEQPTIKEYTIKQVIFIIPSGSSDAQVKAVKRRADAFRPSIAGCDAVLAQTEGMRDVVVKNVGRRDASQLPKPLIEKLDAIQVSQGTETNRISQGYEILVLCDVREVASDAGARQEVRSEMMDKEGQLLARRYIRDLKQDAVIDIRQ